MMFRPTLTIPRTTTKNIRTILLPDLDKIERVVIIVLTFCRWKVTNSSLHLQKINQKEEMRWKENIVFRAIRAR